MKALLLAACAVVALCGASGCDAGKTPAAGAPASDTRVGSVDAAEKAVQPHYPLLFSEERARASFARERDSECNVDPEWPVTGPPGPGEPELASAIKAGDWKAAAKELVDEDGVPPGLSSADRKRLERIRLSVRMTTPARRGDLQAVQALLKAGADPSFEVDYMAGALHWAAQCDRVEVLKALIAAGADVDRRHRWEVGRAEYRSTPLMVAVFHGAPGSVRVLLEAGANPNLYEEVRETGDGGGPWARRAYGVLNMGTTNEIVRLLLDGGANPNFPGAGGRRPLMDAAEERDPEKARLLLARGADPAAHDDEGETAATLARKAGAPEVLAVLEAPAR